VTSQGHPWAIYDRAIKAGSLAGAVAAAHNLNQPIVLDQALRLLLLYLRHDPGRYPRAAARWAASAATRQVLSTCVGLPSHSSRTLTWPPARSQQTSPKA